MCRAPIKVGIVFSTIVLFSALMIIIADWAGKEWWDTSDMMMVPIAWIVAVIDGLVLAILQRLDDREATRERRNELAREGKPLLPRD